MGNYSDATAMTILFAFVGAIVFFGLTYLAVRLGTRHAMRDIDHERKVAEARAKAAATQS